MFTNATNVMIGNKEVESIVTSDGGILYQKPSTDNYALSLSSDKNSISYANSETATLTATLTNNGIGAQGKTIIFEDANATPIISNMPSSSTPNETVYDIGSKWKLIATSPVSSGSQIDIYIPNTSNYLRIRPKSGGYRIENTYISYITGNNYAFLNGSALYCNHNVIYTDEGDSLDLSTYYGQDAFSQIKFIVNSTISSVVSLLSFVVTDANGEATLTYVPTGTGNFTIQANYETLQDSVQITVT